MKTNVLILGGGASGLAAAIEAARCGASVTVLEKLDRVGKKILATGNGRCNLLNIHASPADYNDPDFVGRIFGFYGVESNLAFFRTMGLLTTTDSEGRVYPRSLAASTVLDVLRFEAARLGVTFLCGEAAETVQKENVGFVVNRKYRADTVIVACGGKAAPAQGSDGSGYKLLQSFGHKITPLRPALVQLRTETDFVKQLKGLRTTAALTLGAHRSDGEILFTDYGLSGIAAMELSRYAKDGAKLCIDLLPEYSEQAVFALLCEAAKRGGSRPAEQLLTGILQNRIAQALLKSAGLCLSAPCETLTAHDLQSLAQTVKQKSVRVLGTKGFPDAQVTAGGAEISGFTDTLESRYAPGLFAAGEILNIDGKCGGYNLTFAWSSGRLSGASAARKREHHD